VVSIAAVLYAIICVYMALTLTRPDRHPFAHVPEQFGLAYESVAFPSRIDALPLRGWLLHPPAGTPTHRRPVIMVHGKGTDREAGPGDGILGIAAPLVRAGYDVLTFDLRGSGESGGDHFTLGAEEVRDLGGAIDLLAARGLAPEGVDVLGFSMGASTSMLVAETDPRVRALVEDSGYADLGQLLDEQVPRASGLPGFFTPGMVLAARTVLGVDLYAIRPIDGLPALARAGVPLMIIHGEDDTYVPTVNGHRLAEAYGPQAETLFVPGAKHVESHEKAPQLYDARVLAFFDRSES
jgi:pimeloyl-ACP methyl ester carboxylesterase